MSRVLAVIPARAGSKSMARKNVRLLGGHPLIEWTVSAAKEARCLHELAVSTDDLDVAWLCEREFGVGVIRRLPELGRDGTPDLPVARHALEALGADASDLLVWLRPTSPFRTAGDIDHAVETMQANELASSLRAVRGSQDHPRKCYRQRDLTAGGVWLEPWLPSHAANGPRQTLEPAWTPTGFLDCVWAWAPMGGTMEGHAILGWPTPAGRDVDLDDERDWQTAEALVKAHRWEPGKLSVPTLAAS